MRLKWNKIKQYDEKTKDSDLSCHTMDPRDRGWALWCSVGRQGLLVKTVTAATLVSAALCQLIRIIPGYKGE
jgi:hypothetical protein